MREIDKDQMLEDLQKRVSELETQVKSLLNDKELLRPQWEYTNVWDVNYTNVKDGSLMKLLGECGKQGWEICSSNVVYDSAGVPNTMILLKRIKFV